MARPYPIKQKQRSQTVQIDLHTTQHLDGVPQQGSIIVYGTGVVVLDHFIDFNLEIRYKPVEITITGVVTELIG